MASKKISDNGASEFIDEDEPELARSLPHISITTTPRDPPTEEEEAAAQKELAALLNR